VNLQKPILLFVFDHQSGSSAISVLTFDIIMRNIWRSQRLIFRAAELSDEPFLHSINQYNSDSFQNATHLLPVPQGKSGAANYCKFLQGALLGCIVCIPGPAKTDIATTDGVQAVSEPIPIGTIALLAPDPTRSHHRNTSVAVSIAHPYQNKGYGGEAILWAVEWAFQHANMHRVSIGAFSFNEGAVRLYQRLGFVLEGRTRECAWYNGKFHDTVEMGMLRGEWLKLYGETAEVAQ
jgi:GNAT superfamily N-acetyltransferase